MKQVILLLVVVQMLVAKIAEVEAKDFGQYGSVFAIKEEGLLR